MPNVFIPPQWSLRQTLCQSTVHQQLRPIASPSQLLEMGKTRFPGAEELFVDYLGNSLDTASPHNRNMTIHLSTRIPKKTATPN